MAMPAALRPFTVDDIETFPNDGNRYELPHGVVLVTSTRSAEPIGCHGTDGVAGDISSGGAAGSRLGAGRRAEQTQHSSRARILVGTMPPESDWEAVQEHWLTVLDERLIRVSHADGERDVVHDRAVSWRSPGRRELLIDIPALFLGL